MATTQQMSAAEVLSRVREISGALDQATLLVEEAAAKTHQLVAVFDTTPGADLPRFEGAVWSELTTLAHNLGVDLDDGIRGDVPDVGRVASDARELVALTEFAAKGDDDGR